VEALIGCRLGEIDAAVVERMISLRLREDTDVDFKRDEYAATDKGHQDAAADVAAMANGPGGVIFLGIRDHDGAAAELVPVTFSETTELRLRQAIISRTAPAPFFVVHRIPLAANPEHGVYLIIVSPSPYAPHAVRTDSRLGYPRRSGPHTRWLSESEVADSYRSRFISGEQRSARLDAVRTAGAWMLAATKIWVATALVPAIPGTFTLRRRSMVELHGASLRWHQEGYGSHVFLDGPRAEADVGRVALMAGAGEGRTSRSGHAELHTDGSAFAATPVGDIAAQRNVSTVDDEWLLEAVIATSSMCLDFATERAGATGDAYVSTSVIAGSAINELELTHTRFHGARQPFDAAHRVSGGNTSRALISLEDAATGPGRLIIARMLLSEILQWFGLPEVLQITEDGKLRRPYFAQHNRQRVEAWAAANGVEMIETTLEVEP
jgi:hypothetical protein